MAALNVKKLTVEELLEAQEAIDGELQLRLSTLQDQIIKIQSDRKAGKLPGRKSAKSPSRRGARKGVKVAPKYKDRSGNTWTGRGRQPRWLAAAIAKGKKVEDFAIKS